MQLSEITAHYCSDEILQISQKKGPQKSLYQTGFTRVSQNDLKMD